jgi:hypothetical protein
MLGDCEVCGNQLKQVSPDWAHVGRECPRCGHFYIDTISDGLREKFEFFGFENKEQMVRLSGWIREQNAAGVAPTLTREVIARVIAKPRPDLRTRAMMALRELSKREDALLGARMPRGLTENKSLHGITYSEDGKDIYGLLRYLEFERLAEWQHNPDGLVITVPGALAVEKMASSGADFGQGFVAMWFNAAFDAVWTDGFSKAISDAGFRPIRIDKKDYVGGISDEIIAEIRRSRFAVVDYTEQVNGAYFEAGFALGLGLTVIPTCRADQIDKLHFDIRHLNTLPWKEPADLAVNLAKRIVAILGTGPFRK